MTGEASRGFGLPSEQVPPDALPGEKPPAPPPEEPPMPEDTPQAPLLSDKPVGGEPAISSNAPSKWRVPFNIAGRAVQECYSLFKNADSEDKKQNYSKSVLWSEIAYVRSRFSGIGAADEAFAMVSTATRRHHIDHADGPRLQALILSNVRCC